MKETCITTYLSPKYAGSWEELAKRTMVLMKKKRKKEKKKPGDTELDCVQYPK